MLENHRTCQGRLKTESLQRNPWYLLLIDQLLLFTSVTDIE
jgi:hypothetical protein